MLKIGLFGNTHQTGKMDKIRELISYLQQIKAEIWIEKNFYHYLSKHFQLVHEITGIIHPGDYPFEIALSIGGDGTFLQTAASINCHHIPILGINTGGLGFLAEISVNEIPVLLSEITNHNYRVEERSLLYMNVDGDHTTAQPFALNEVAILKRDTSAMISIEVYINEEFLTTYLADGLVVATPTGSTAYSMSLNGPILLPWAKNMILSPVAPHSLNVRPLVIPDDSLLRLQVHTRSSNFLVALDGRSQVFPSGKTIFVRKGDFTIQVIKRLHHTFYQTLRDKLKWGEDVRDNRKQSEVKKIIIPLTKRVALTCL